MSMFKKATKKKLKARIALDGPSGSGKTYTGLRFAFALAGGQSGKVAVIDTEYGSASKYQGESPDKFPWEFDVCELENFAPSTYTAVLKSPEIAKYDVVLVDSLSHAWEGVGGALEQVSKKGGNSFTAWKDVTPQHRQMIEAILSCPCHVIVTMRTKTEYVLEEQTNKSGKTVQVPKKIGMAPIQRAGMEYEFDVVLDLDLEHTLTVSKTRCSALDGKVVSKPGPAFVSPFMAWLGQGSDVPVEESSTKATLDEAKPNETEQSAAKPATKSKGVKLSGKQDEHSATIHDPCGEEMARQIKEAAQKMEVPPSKLKEVMSRNGAAKLSDLPLGPAQELLAKLNGGKTKKEAPF